MDSGYNGCGSEMLDRLPFDVWLAIFCHLSVKSIVSLGLVSLAPSQCAITLTFECNLRHAGIWLI
jgi:hypothetical protein